jgi:Mitochondrial carrier protein
MTSILFWSPATVGAVTAFGIDTLFNPVLRARTIQAIGGFPEYNGLVSTLKSIRRTEGFRGLYRGLPWLASLSPAATGLYIFSYNQFKKWGPKGSGNEFLAATGAQFVGAFLWVPCALFTESRHLTKKQSDLYSLSARGLIRHITKGKGIRGVRHLYPGYFTQNIGYGLFHGFSMEGAAKAKSWLKEMRQRELHPLEIAGCYATCCTIAAAGTTPIDTTKICYQMDRVSDPSSKSLLTTMKKMYKKGGIAAFWKGTPARIALLAPRQTIVISVVDLYARRLRD